MHTCDSSYIVIALLSCRHSRLQGLSDRADLVDFKQQAIAGLFGHTLGDAFRVGDCEVITHHLNAGAGCEIGPCLPVILVKWVLNGHHCGDKKMSRAMFGDKSNSSVVSEANGEKAIIYRNLKPVKTNFSGHLEAAETSC